MALNCWLLRISPGIHSIAVPCARGVFAVTSWPGLCAGADVAVGLAAADPNASPGVRDRGEDVLGGGDAAIHPHTGV